VDSPFDVRGYNFALKPQQRLEPLVGPMIHGVQCAAGALTDSRGLSDRDADNLLECSTQEDGMAVFNKQDLSEGLIFDFGKTVPLESVQIWNYNKPAYTDRGVSKVSVSVWTESAGWKAVLKDALLSEAEGTDDYDEPVLLTFDSVPAQKVRFDNLVGFNSNSPQLGLSEIRFYSPLGPAACNPTPEEKSTIPFSQRATLGWTAGRNSLVHAIYLSENPTVLEMQGKFTGPARVGVEGLKPDTTYYWYCVEIQEDGTATEGPLWSFRTQPAVTALWPMDNSNSVEDLQGSFKGTIHGTPEWVEGRYGKGLQFNGVEDYIEIPPLNLNSDSATLCGWLRIPQENPSYSGIVFCRSEGTASGLNFRNGRILGYHWKDAENTYSWDSGLEVPLNQWVFAALTVEPSKAVLYVWDGKEMKTAFNEVPHQTEAFSSPVQIGRDPLENTRFFNGTVDEIRVFSYALTDDQVKSLCSGGQSASSEIRLVNASFVKEDQSLKEIARQAGQQEASSEGRRKMNWMAVLVILAVVLAIAVVSTFKKKK